jgi:oligopeptide transport system substrate-binding protein
MHSRLLSFSLLLVLTLNACNSSQNKEYTIGDSRYGHVLVMNQFSPFDILFPPMSYEGSAAQLGSQIYEPLVGYDSENGKLAPLLAESWEENAEHTEFRFKIRQGVYFHNNRCFNDGKGRLLTPLDVLYALTSLCENSVYNKNAGLFTGQILGAVEFFSKKKRASEDHLEGISLNSDDEVVVKLIKPNVEFIHLLAHYATSIYPKEAKTTYGKELDNNPVGTGPFYSKSYRKNEVCLLARNDRYWGKDENDKPLPFLDGIKMGFSSSGKTVRSAMDKELIHLIIDPDLVEDGNLGVSMTESDFSPYSKRQVLDLETTFLGFLNDEGVFADKNVRLAFSYAIDRTAVINNVMANRCTPGLHGLVPPAFTNYPFEEVKSPNVNVDSALYYLEQAGFPKGAEFPVTSLQIQNRFKDVLVAQEIQKQVLEKLGISLSITALPKDQHFKRIEDRKTQIWLDNWIGDFMDPQNFLSLLLSRNTPENESSFLNIYRFKNSQFDSLVDEALKLAGLEKRMDIYSQADRLLMKEAAIVPLYYEKMEVIQHVSLKGINDPILGRFDFRKAYIISAESL